MLLAVDVSDSSLHYDVKTRQPLYARFAIPTVWIVDVPHATLHVFDELQGGDYQRCDVFISFEPLSLEVAGEYPVRLIGLFP